MITTRERSVSNLIWWAWMTGMIWDATVQCFIAGRGITAGVSLVLTILCVMAISRHKRKVLEVSDEPKTGPL